MVDNTIISIKYIKYLMEKHELVQDTDEKIAILERVFEYLILNPVILATNIYFRKIIISKLTQIENELRYQAHFSNIARYNDTVLLLKKSVNIHIKNRRIRGELNGLLDKLYSGFEEYDMWVRRPTLSLTIDTLKGVLNDIRTYPNYIADE